MMIQQISSPALGRINAAAPQSVPAAPTQILPMRTLPVFDSMEIDSVRTGQIPAALNFFPSGTQVDAVLSKLASNPSQDNFKAALAQYRVAIRQLSLPNLEAAAAQLQGLINQSGDYRTQVFLDQALVETRIEIQNKGGKPGFAEPTMPPIPGAEPKSIVENSLKQLNSHASEANFRTSQAGFRVAIRSLSLEQLKATEGLIAQAIAQTSDHRSQKLLDSLMLDAKLEIARKGGQPGFPEPTMPPIPGTEPKSIVENSLKQLNSHASEANFRTSQAGFRVAIRSLSLEQLKATDKLVREAIKSTPDYRSQKLLDALLVDLLMEATMRPKA
ncbi:MAG: hypothetical protein AB7I41_02035 [Candidatus Sericytochromatia bacterium]